MKCNFKRPKLTKEEQQDMASMKSTLPYIDRMQINNRNREMIIDHQEESEGDNNA